MTSPAPRRRITFVVSHLSPVLGLEKVTLCLIKALSTTYDVNVIVLGGSEEDTCLYHGVEVLGTPLRGVRRTLSVIRLLPIVCRQDLGTVILAGVWAAIPWLILAPRRVEPTIVWEHTLMSEKLRSSRSIRLLSYLSRILYRRASSIIAVSAAVGDDMAKYRGIRKVLVIPNVVETPTPHIVAQTCERRVPDPHSLVCVGSLTSVKSQHLAIRALALLDPAYRLTIIGTGPSLERLRSLAVDLEVDKRTTFTGFLPPPMIRATLERASMLVHCSVAETFGLVYTEAANLGVPVLSVLTRTSKKMIPYYAPGWLCLPEPELIAEMIQTKSNTRISDEDFVVAAERRGVDFGPTKIQKQWTKLLEDDHGTIH
ncbi:glycosyltransferase [Arthrobacter sp. A5]|uniref:glycosyltransferase n=1 Tax=Arthrobacter sp. A5 TaxID=576926 RepID=UPI003DAA1073